MGSSQWDRALEARQDPPDVVSQGSWKLALTNTTSPALPPAGLVVFELKHIHGNQNRCGICISASLRL
jgi:hypothetical protein